MALVYPTDYYERFDRFDHSDYRRFLFLASRGLQSSELNDFQSWIKYERKQYGNALFLTEDGRGEHLRGNPPSVDNSSGEVRIDEGLIYIDGEIYPVSEARSSDEEKTNIISVTKGSNGGMDSLRDDDPQDSIIPHSQELVSIDRIEWDSNDLIEGTDYSISGTNVDWSPSGTEPTSGESYLVEYTYTSVFNLPDEDDNYDIGIVLAQDIIRGGHSMDIGDYQIHKPITDEDHENYDERLEDTLQSIAQDNRGKPGSHRLRVRAFWSYADRNSDGTNDDPINPSDLEGAFNGSLDFYPIYYVSGFNLQNLSPPTAGAISQALARYDFNSNGHYIIDGFEVSSIQYPSGNEISNGVTDWDEGGDGTGEASDLSEESGALEVTTRSSSGTGDDWAEQSFKVMEGSFYKVQGKFKSGEVDGNAISSVSITNDTIEVSDSVSRALRRGNRIQKARITFASSGIPSGAIAGTVYFVKETSTTNVWEVHTVSSLDSKLNMTSAGSSPTISIFPEVSIGISFEDFPVSGGFKSYIIDGPSRVVDTFGNFEFTFQAPLIEDGGNDLVGITNLYEYRESEIERGSTSSEELDPPDDPSSERIYRIISVVNEDGTSYTPGTDFEQYTNNITWLTGGSSPSDGDMYEATYQYIIDPADRPDPVANNQLTRVFEGSILLRVGNDVSESTGFFDDLVINDLDEVGYQVSRGEAHVNGYEVVTDYTARLLFDGDPDVSQSDETSFGMFTDTESPFDFSVNLADIPMHVSKSIRIILQDTDEIVRSSENSDGLNFKDSRNITRLVSVSMGGTTYVEGTDWRKADNTDPDVVEDSENIYWRSEGSSPTEGDTYNVVYEYTVDVSLAAIEDGLNIPDSLQYEANYESYEEGGVTEYSSIRVIVHTDRIDFRLIEERDDNLSLVSVNVIYDQRLLRTDRLVLDQEGRVHLIRGESHKFTPSVPPTELLSLASVQLDWIRVPFVVNDGVRVVPQNVLQDIKDSVRDLYRLTAIDRLNVNVAVRDSAVKHGVFSDPFVDDRLRETEILPESPQDAAIVNGFLQLGIDDTVEDLSVSSVSSLNYDSEVTDAVQLKSTRDRVINPYTVFDPLPPVVTLTPAIDQWSETRTEWLSDITREFSRTTVRGGRTRRRTTTTESVVEQTTEAIRFARERSVTFDITGFGPSEALGSIVFGVNNQNEGGISLSFTAVSADSDGVLSGSFTVPSNHLADNRYNVVFRGSDSATNPSVAVASYESRGSRTTIVRQRVRTITTTRARRIFVDPLAQTFTLSQDRMVTGVRLWPSQVGDTSEPVWIELVDVAVGIPTTNILRRVTVAGTELNINDPLEKFWDPIHLRSNVEYAIVVKTNDPDHSLRVAELGKFDPEFGWVTSQPYQVGVLLSSSNAQTWTPHQEEDMKFAILGANYTQTERTVNLGSVELPTGTTDLLVEVDVERPSLNGDSTDVRFLLVRDGGGETYSMDENSPIQLDSAISGGWDLKARLTGISSGLASPSVDKDISVVAGVLKLSGAYITKEFSLVSGDTITAVLEQDIPGDATITVEYQDGVNSDNEPVWTAITKNSSVDDLTLEDGFIEREYLSSALTRTKSRIRITLTGTAKDRPRVRNLRGFTKA